MSKKLGEFIHNLLVKAGQNSDAEPIKQFFLAPELMNIDVPDELITALDNNLLSIPDATNNHPKIKGHYDKQILDGLDKVISEVLADVPEDAKKSVFEERSTYKRIPLLITKIKELEAKKLEATNKPDKDAINQQKEAYQKQLDDLAFKLRKRDEEMEGIRKDADNRVMKINIKSEVKNMLSNYKTVYDELPSNAKNAAIQSLLDTELNNNEAEFYLDDKDNFAIRKKDGTNYLGDNHQQIMPQAFIESLLSRNKLLKVTTDQASGDNTNNNGQNRNPTNVEGNRPQRNGALADLVKQAQESLSAASPVM